MTGPGEYRGLHTNGDTFDIEVNAEFLRNAEEKPTNMVFIVRDITNRKRAEEAIKGLLEEKEFILKELQHRVKNSIGIILEPCRTGGGEGGGAGDSDDPRKARIADSRSRIAL